MKLKIPGYTPWQNFTQEYAAMPKTKLPGQKKNETFGQRMARLRQAAGYSQRELAAEIKISQRMIAYYESKAEHPPTHILPLLAQALGVSTDQLLGVEQTKPKEGGRDNRLWRRFRQVEKLSPAQRKPIIQVLDAFLQGTAPKRG